MLQPIRSLGPLTCVNIGRNRRSHCKKPMGKDAILVELVSESLNAASATRRRAAKFLLDSLRAGLPLAEISARIEAADHSSANDFSIDARKLANRLGVLK